MSETVIDLIERHEGLRLHPYTDTVGKLTIGYGRNLTDSGIRQSEAKTMLCNDLDALIQQLAYRGWFSKLNQTRQAVILDMAYNLGLAGLLQFQKMIAAIQADDYAEAAAQILDSAAARQLPNRYHELAHLMETRT